MEKERTLQEQGLFDLLEPTVTDCGLSLVDVRLRSDGGTVLDVRVNRDGGVTLDECGTTARRLGRLLDVEDPLTGEYRLEVGSPGLEDVSD
jgi:ribosome maturation factor RimP